VFNQKGQCSQNLFKTEYLSELDKCPTKRDKSIQVRLLETT